MDSCVHDEDECSDDKQHGDDDQAEKENFKVVVAIQVFHAHSVSEQMSEINLGNRYPNSPASFITSSFAGTSASTVGTGCHISGRAARSSLWTYICWPSPARL